MWTASCLCGDTAFFHNPKYDDITCIRHLKMWQTPNGDTSVHECDKLLIRDSPMIVRWPPYGSYSFFHKNVKWPPDPRYSFFTAQKYDDIHDSSFENFWKAYIWICASLHWLQSNAPDVRIIFKDFVWVNACPPTAGGGRSTQNKNVCVDALHHKPTCP